MDRRSTSGSVAFAERFSPVAPYGFVFQTRPRGWMAAFSNDTMRVLLTTPYDLAVPGGVNGHALGLMSALGRSGVDVRLLGPSSAKGEGMDERIRTVGRVSVRAMNGASSRVTLDWRIREEVRAQLQEFRPDVIHLQEPFLPLLNTFCLANAGRTACVGTFHTYSESSRGYLWAWPYCRWVGRRLQARIAVSEAAREFAARYHPGAYRVVPNGIEPPGVERRRAAGGLKRPVRLLFVGRADEPRKGFGVLLGAMRRLEAERPGVFALTVAGPGSEGWREAAEGLPVRLAGRLTEARLAAEYREADLCVVPSRGGESFGLVALEALAHGVPVVASRIRGYADWLAAAEAGCLVAPGDAEALAEALRGVVKDPGRYAEWTRRGPELAAGYGWDLIAARVMEVYEEARSKGPGAG